MLYLLSGSDGFTKKEYIKSIQAQFRLELVFCDLDEVVLKQALQQTGDLFGKQSLMVFNGFDGELLEKYIESLVEAKTTFVITVDSLDKRLNFVKKIIQDERIKKVEFNPPTGVALEKWVSERVKSLAGSIDDRAVRLLLLRLGLDFNQKWDSKSADLDLISTEIQKLTTYKRGSVIDEQSVKELVVDLGESSVFAILDTLGKDGTGSFTATKEFFDNPSVSDDKAKAIQLAAILADQFRSILLVKSYIENNIPESEMVARSGYKPGRIAIMRKLASRYETKALLGILKKLASLDEELKSSNIPPRVMVDMIISQL